MNEIKIFENERFGEVRVAGTSENPLFCLADVAKCLDIKNVSDLKTRLNQKGVVITDTPTKGGEQKMVFINESNLYKCVFQSRKEEAEQFQDWICDEVLPSIRKTGGYVNDSSTFVDSYFSDLDDSAKQFLVQTLDTKKKLLEENKKQKERIAIMKPKEEFYDTVTGSPDTIDMRQVATTLNIKGVGRNKMFDILRTKGILDRKNIPYQTYVDRGYFRTVESSYTKGDIVCLNIKTVVFQKGVDFIKKVILDYLND